MTTRTLTAAAVTVSALPLALGALMWHGLRLRRDLSLAIDPFEIDLQLHERNDDE